MRVAAALIAAFAASAVLAAPDTEIVPRTFPVPARTSWRPEGCRSVPFTHPVVPPRTAYRRAHGGLESGDEVDVAYAPVFAREWIAEPSLYQVTTPSFDSAGNLYMTPLLPHEPILMISLEPTAGARRFVVPLEPGDRGGGSVPMVLRDPDTGGEVVYVNAYRRVVAVRTDGTIVWNVPTGFGDATTPAQSPIGIAWVPNADAIVVLTRDGFVLLLDRKTGAPLLDQPLQLPGEKSPPRGSTIPQALADEVDVLLEPLVTFSSGGGVLDLIEVLLGGSSEVANNLSVNPRTNSLWIAATAPDADDGTVDGVSAFGALYRLDVVPSGDRWTLATACSRTFSGGSASTPTVGQNGTRVYFGDDAGALIAIDAADCAVAWSVPLDSQIFGSIAAGSNGRELFASSAGGIFQVFDDGATGRRGWTAALEVYDIPASLANYSGMNLLLAGIGANGLLIQAGAGIRGAQSIPVRTGIVHVDRQTGEPRWFADGLEESLGAMSTGPDGVLYLPHAPLRRAFALALDLTSAPLVGGVSKWAAQRLDLLARDAFCAAADRSANAKTVAGECLDGAVADLDQVVTLRTQALAAADQAVAAGDLSAKTNRRLQRLAGKVRNAPKTRSAKTVTRWHKKAAKALGRACALLPGRPSEPRGQNLANHGGVCLPGRST